MIDTGPDTSPKPPDPTAVRGSMRLLFQLRIMSEGQHVAGPCRSCHPAPAFVRRRMAFPAPLLATLLALMALAPVPAADFSFRRPVTLPAPGAFTGRIRLDTHVATHTRPDWSDMELLDLQGNELPFQLAFRRPGPCPPPAGSGHDPSLLTGRIRYYKSGSPGQGSTVLVSWPRLVPLACLNILLTQPERQVTVSVDGLLSAESDWIPLATVQPSMRGAHLSMELPFAKFPLMRFRFQSAGGITPPPLAFQGMAAEAWLIFRSPHRLTRLTLRYGAPSSSPVRPAPRHITGHEWQTLAVATMAAPEFGGDWHQLWREPGGRRYFVLIGIAILIAVWLSWRIVREARRRKKRIKHRRLP